MSYTTAARPAAPVLRLSMVSEWRLEWRGEAYQTYRIQRTTDLAAWATVATVTADRHGSFTVYDLGPPAAAAFYRTAL